MVTKFEKCSGVLQIFYVVVWQIEFSGMKVIENRFLWSVAMVTKGNFNCIFHNLSESSENDKWKHHLRMLIIAK